LKVSIVFNEIKLIEKLLTKVEDSLTELMDKQICYFGRTYTQGKKVSRKDGVAAFFYIIKYNVFYK